MGSSVSTRAAQAVSVSEADAPFVKEYTACSSRRLRECLDVYQRAVVPASTAVDGAQFDVVFGPVLGDCERHFMLFGDGTPTDIRMVFGVFACLSGEPSDRMAGLMFDVCRVATTLVDDDALDDGLTPSLITSLFSICSRGLSHLLAVPEVPRRRLQLFDRELALLRDPDSASDAIARSVFVNWFHSTSSIPEYMSTLRFAVLETCDAAANMTKALGTGGLFNNADGGGARGDGQSTGDAESEASADVLLTVPVKDVQRDFRNWVVVTEAFESESVLSLLKSLLRRRTVAVVYAGTRGLSLPARRQALTGDMPTITPTTTRAPERTVVAVCERDGVFRSFVRTLKLVGADAEDEDGVDSARHVLRAPPLSSSRRPTSTTPVYNFKSEQLNRAGQQWASTRLVSVKWSPKTVSLSSLDVPPTPTPTATPTPPPAAATPTPVETPPGSSASASLSSAPVSPLSTAAAAPASRSSSPSTSPVPVLSSAAPGGVGAAMTPSSSSPAPTRPSVRHRSTSRPVRLSVTASLSVVIEAPPNVLLPVFSDQTLYSCAKLLRDRARTLGFVRGNDLCVPDVLSLIEPHHVLRYLFERMYEILDVGIHMHVRDARLGAGLAPTFLPGNKSAAATICAFADADTPVALVTNYDGEPRLAITADWLLAKVIAKALPGNTGALLEPFTEFLNDMDDPEPVVPRCRLDDSVAEVLQQFVTRSLAFMFVEDGEGKLMGVITPVDLLDYALYVRSERFERDST